MTECSFCKEVLSLVNNQSLARYKIKPKIVAVDNDDIIPIKISIVFSLYSFVLLFKKVVVFHIL